MMKFTISCNPYFWSLIKGGFAPGSTSADSSTCIQLKFTCWLMVDLRYEKDKSIRSDKGIRPQIVHLNLSKKKGSEVTSVVLSTWTQRERWVGPRISSNLQSHSDPFRGLSITLPDMSGHQAAGFSYVFSAVQMWMRKVIWEELCKILTIIRQRSHTVIRPLPSSSYSDEIWNLALWFFPQN